MAKRARKSYTESQRQEILNAALKDGLTALQVQKKFGVTPVTYYSWRKKKGIRGPRGRRPALVARGGDLTAQVRAGAHGRSRYAPHFRMQGDKSVHYGLFDCGPAGAPAADGAKAGCC